MRDPTNVRANVVDLAEWKDLRRRQGLPRAPRPRPLSIPDEAPPPLEWDDPLETAPLAGRVADPARLVARLSLYRRIWARTKRSLDGAVPGEGALESWDTPRERAVHDRWLEDARTLDADQGALVPYLVPQPDRGAVTRARLSFDDVRARIERDRRERGE